MALAAATAAAATRRGLPQLLGCGLLQQLRALSGTAGPGTAALQQSAAAAPADEAAPAAGEEGGLQKMNLCNAVNSALHIAMASDSK